MKGNRWIVSWWRGVEELGLPKPRGHLGLKTVRSVVASLIDGGLGRGRDGWMALPNQWT